MSHPDIPRRVIPFLAPAEGWQDYPARLLAQGWDTYAESWNVIPKPETLARIAAAKREAEEADPRREAPRPIELGGETFQVAPHGAAGGVIYRLDHPDFLVMLRSPETDWCLTVRYLAWGLWRHGLPSLRDRAAAIIRAAFEPALGFREPVVSRCDYAMDFHAPAFAGEARHALADSFLTGRGQAKVMTVATGERVQTYTVGSIARLQVTLYDKSAEIVEASGKDWFKALWGMPPGDPGEDVWRIEARFSAEWLRERAIRSHAELSAEFPALLATALTDRRLCLPDASRVRRASVHPLWWRAIQAAGDARDVPAVGWYSTLRPEEYRAILTRQVAGTLRALAAGDDAAAPAPMVEAAAAAAIRAEAADPERKRKLSRILERWRWMQEGRA